jgi:hypothetical protein
MSRRSRNATIISTGLVAIALVAGCSGSTGAPAPQAPAASAPASPQDEAAALLERMPEATYGAGSARFEMQINISAQGQRATSTGTGSYDFARNIGELTMEGFLGVPGQVETITDGNTVYLRPSGQPNWFRAPAGAGPAQVDPAQQLEMLRDAASDLRVVGTEQVRGTETRHITFNFDASQMVQNSAPGASVTGPVPAEVWIDSDGRARKFHITVPVQQQGTSGESDVTVEYFDFGVPVDVQVPDPATVQELPTG